MSCRSWCESVRSRDIVQAWLAPSPRTLSREEKPPARKGRGFENCEKQSLEADSKRETVGARRQRAIGNLIRVGAVRLPEVRSLLPICAHVVALLRAVALRAFDRLLCERIEGTKARIVRGNLSVRDGRDRAGARGDDVGIEQRRIDNRAGIEDVQQIAACEELEFAPQRQ